jgi:hypothetical protein
MLPARRPTFQANPQLSGLCAVLDPQGLATGSASLTGWALGSAVERLASIIVIWRFTGARALTEMAERRAQRGVAVSFWLLAPYIAADSARDLAAGHRAAASAARQASPKRAASTASSRRPLLCGVRG